MNILVQIFVSDPWHWQLKQLQTLIAKQVSTYLLSEINQLLSMFLFIVL